ncbi:MAG: endopeptidase La [Candidatus Falkowbacteria bacterium]
MEFRNFDKKITAADIPEKLEVITFENLVIFPRLPVPVLQITKGKDNIEKGGFCLFVLKNDQSSKNGIPGENYSPVGVSAMVMDKTINSAGKIEIRAHGLCRFKISKLAWDKNGVWAIGKNINEENPDIIDDEISELLNNFTSDMDCFFRRVLNNEQGFSCPNVTTLGDLGLLTDESVNIIADNALGAVLQKQRFLEIIDPRERFLEVFKYLKKTLNALELLGKVEKDARDEYIKERKFEYWLRVLDIVNRRLAVFAAKPPAQSEPQKLIGGKDQVPGEPADDCGTYAEKIKALNLPPEAQKEAERELKRLSASKKGDSEYEKSANYLDWILSLPWNTVTEDNLDIAHAKDILEADHFGLDYAKDTILEYLGVGLLGQQRKKSDKKGNILLFVGPPGTGKTSLGASIARAMGRKFIRFSLGGLRDEAEIKGHRRTYVGAMPGRIIELMKRAGTKNPVIMLDEIDKIGKDYRGDPADTLLEVLDPEQNFAFSDHYLGVPFDLSRVMFILTANNPNAIPGPLKDRTEKVWFSSYTIEEKRRIGRNHLISKQLKENNLEPDEIEFGDDTLRKIIRDYTREAGVRSLEKQIQRICRKIATKKALGCECRKLVGPADVREYLGVEKFTSDSKLSIEKPGIVCGLAWTTNGGLLLYIETIAMKGTGKITQTGLLGEVMAQSITIAVKYIEAQSKEWNISKEYLKKEMDIHLHAPSGAIPKDGPSAGITILTALVSILTGVKADSDTAMTGEITLRGDILPVGGIKEKVIAAYNEGMKRIILPAACRPNVEQDVPGDIREGLSFHYVTRMNEALEIALGKSIHKPATKKA